MRTRKPHRLKDFDYSKDGFYFITICSKNRENIFGDVIVGADGCRPAQVALNDFGRIVDEELQKSPMIRKEIVLDHYVVMPNHVHCIVVIEQNHRGLTGREIAGRQPSAPTVSGMIQWFKTMSTNDYIRNVKTNDMPLSAICSRLMPLGRGAGSDVLH